MRLVALVIGLAMVVSTTIIAFSLRYEINVIAGRVPIRTDRWTGCSQVLWPEPGPWKCLRAESGTTPKSLSTRIQPSKYGIVEGERFGEVSLGMSIDDVRRVLSLPLSSASDEGTLLRYDWPTPDQESWSVWFDKTTKRAVSIWYFPRLAFLNRDLQRQYRQNVKFETTRGARYGHSGETIKTLYGMPSKVIDRESNVSYWYEPLRIEFFLVCDVDYKPISKCPDWARRVEQIRIFSKGWHAQ